MLAGCWPEPAVRLPAWLPAACRTLHRAPPTAICLPSLLLQAKAGRALPLAIMTSDDTHQRTLALLEGHAYFGATPQQVTLIKQEKVACLAGGRGNECTQGACSILQCSGCRWGRWGAVAWGHPGPLGWPLPVAESLADASHRLVLG